ncbi:MAG: MaoC family dehydratase N-terminal domain-containing protein [Dermabacter sp.]|nr:MaoC family dehydratase N-terminal domain-containing protein [Dermabacter sp.]
MPGANPDFAGREYPPGSPLEVSAVKIREFAEATQSPHPFHMDAEAARAAGYAGVVAPPTFLVALAQREEARYINDPEARVDFSRVVHSEESFALTRPIVAGDVLTPRLTVESIKGLGPHSLVTTRVDFADETATHVATVRSSLVIRGEDAS